MNGMNDAPVVKTARNTRKHVKHDELEFYKMDYNWKTVRPILVRDLLKGHFINILGSDYSARTLFQCQFHETALIKEFLNDEDKVTVGDWALGARSIHTGYFYCSKAKINTLLDVIAPRYKSGKEAYELSIIEETEQAAKDLEDAERKELQAILNTEARKQELMSKFGGNG